MKTVLPMSRWAGRVLVALVAAVLVIDGISVARGCSQLRPPQVGDPAPDFTLPRIGAGGTIAVKERSLSSFRGKVVVIDFWATWCQPCRQSMPVVQRMVAAHPGEVELFSVCTDGHERADEARELVDQLAPAATLVADRGEIADRYGVATIPHVLVLDRDGLVVGVEANFRDAASLERFLATTIDDALSR